MTSFCPFQPEQFVTYKYLAETNEHYLKNCTASVRTAENLRDTLERFVQGVAAGYQNILIKAVDDASRLELQLALEGAQQLKTGAKVIRLLR